MKTELWRITREDDPRILTAAEYIRRGLLVAFPTETVYGLGADATNEEAVTHIFLAKGRPQDNPLITHIADFEDIDRYVQQVSPAARRLMETFWPGPMTVILKKKPIIPDLVTCGLDTVGLRMPSDTLARTFLRACRTGVAAPSANTSGRPSTTTAQHVYHDLNGKVDLILDGGPCNIGVESTVIDMSGELPTLYRPGGISLEQLRQVLPDVQVDACVKKTLTGDEKVKSPGMKYKHYAPKAPVTILLGEPSAVVKEMKRRIHAAKDEKIGILCYSEYEPELMTEHAVVKSLGSRSSKEENAHLLFAQLRAFDEENVSEIYANCPDEDGIGMAVVNRLSKAAGFHIINV